MTRHPQILTKWQCNYSLSMRTNTSMQLVTSKVGTPPLPFNNPLLVKVESMVGDPHTTLDVQAECPLPDTEPPTSLHCQRAMVCIVGPSGCWQALLVHVLWLTSWMWAWWGYLHSHWCSHLGWCPCLDGHLSLCLCSCLGVVHGQCLEVWLHDWKKTVTELDLNQSGPQMIKTDEDRRPWSSLGSLQIRKFEDRAKTG